MDEQSKPGRETVGPRRAKVLLCVTDGRASVVTQSLLGLGRAADPWLPDELLVITTGEGRANVVKSLFDEGAFASACRAVGASGVRFRPSSVRAIVRSRTNHTPVQVIDGPGSERAAGDFIMNEIARITDDPRTELRVVLNGQERLLGFFAGHALSLLGRGQDRLAYVRVRQNTDGADHHSEAHAQSDYVCVSDVPFLRLDRIVSMRLLARHAEYETICSAFEEGPHLEVRDAFRGVVFRFSRAFDIPCDSSHHVQEPRMEPRAAALYAYYALRARSGLPFISDAELIAHPAQLFRIYDSCLLGGTSKSRHGTRPESLTRDSLVSARSRIGRALKQIIKDGVKFEAYRVHTCRDDRSYGLSLRPEQIQFVDWSLSSGEPMTTADRRVSAQRVAP